MKKHTERIPENLSNIDRLGKRNMIYKSNYYNNDATIYTYDGSSNIYGIEFSFELYGVKYAYGKSDKIGKLLVYIAESIVANSDAYVAEMIIDVVNYLTYDLRCHIVIDDYNYIMQLLKKMVIIS